MKSSKGLLSVGDIEGVRVWEMPFYHDLRGRLFKASPAQDLEEFEFETVEHFFTVSKKYVLRGMHLQGNPHQVSKIISIVQGAAIDFLIDLRTKSRTFQQLQIVNLDEKKPKSIYIPFGVAHGYMSTQDCTIISYRMDGFFCKNCDSGFSPKVIEEHLPVDISYSILSERDKTLSDFSEYNYKSECISKN